MTGWLSLDKLSVIGPVSYWATEDLPRARSAKDSARHTQIGTPDVQKPWPAEVLAGCVLHKECRHLAQSRVVPQESWRELSPQPIFKVGHQTDGLNRTEGIGR